MSFLEFMSFSLLGVDPGNHSGGVVRNQRSSVSEAYGHTENSIKTTSSQSGKIINF